MKTPVTGPEKVAGVFLVGVILAGAGILVARGGLAAEPFVLEVDLARGNGLAPGSRVVLLDLVVGRVARLDLDSDGGTYRVRAELEIDRDYARALPADTTAWIKRPVLAGIQSGEIVLRPGSSPERIESGARIALAAGPVESGPASEIDVVLDRLFPVAERTLRRLEEAATALGDLAGDARTIVARVEAGDPVVRLLLGDEAHRRIEALVARIDALERELEAALPAGEVGALFGSLGETVADLRATVASVKGAVAPLPDLMGRDLPALLATTRADIEEIGSVLGRVRGILDDVEEVAANARTASTSFPEVARRIDLQLVELERILVSVKRNFLIRGNLPDAPATESDARSLPRAR